MGHGRWLVLLVLAILMAGCADESSQAPDDPPILVGFDSLPKQVATVAMTPTPSPVLVGLQSAADFQQPTATPAPPQPTPTLTPYVGIFLGRPTSESGEALADDIPTIAPFVVGPMGNSSVGGLIGDATIDCPIQPAPVFAPAFAADPALQERLGCPVTAGAGEQMAAQPFERGTLYWRQNRQIYALASSGQFWMVPDTWNEGMPPDDPAFSAPAGLVQPIRGFGLVWRTNQVIREAVGWGTMGETLISGFWQDFERGAMLQGLNGQVVAIFTAEGQHSGPLAR
jgi:serine/threonine-protein kinase